MKIIVKYFIFSYFLNLPNEKISNSKFSHEIKKQCIPSNPHCRSNRVKTSARHIKLTKINENSWNYINCAQALTEIWDRISLHRRLQSIFAWGISTISKVLDDANESNRNENE